VIARSALSLRYSRVCSRSTFNPRLTQRALGSIAPCKKSDDFRPAPLKAFRPLFTPLSPNCRRSGCQSVHFGSVRFSVTTLIFSVVQCRTSRFRLRIAITNRLLYQLSYLGRRLEAI
jgi:hypothetical protein